MRRGWTRSGWFEGFCFLCPTGGRDHLKRGGATLGESCRHLKRGLRCKVVLTEHCRGSCPPKGQHRSPAEFGATRSRLHLAQGGTAPVSSPPGSWCGGGFIQGGACVAGTTGTHAFLSPSQASSRPAPAGTRVLPRQQAWVTWGEVCR